MVKHIDRRAGSPDRNGDEPPKLRRPGPGHRTASDFFSEEAQRRDVTRAELLNVLGMVEFSRRESALWRRAWRWLRHHPPITNVPASLATAHAETLEAVRIRMVAEQAAADAEASRE
jgi:hypothetical protein